MVGHRRRGLSSIARPPSGIRPTFLTLAILLGLSSVAWRVATPYRLPYEDPQDYRSRFINALPADGDIRKLMDAQFHRAGGGRKALLMRQELDARLDVQHGKFSQTPTGHLKWSVEVFNSSADTLRAAIFMQSHGVGVFNASVRGYVPLRTWLIGRIAPGEKGTIRDSVPMPRKQFERGGVANTLIGQPDSVAFRPFFAVFGSKRLSDTLVYIPLH